MNKYDINVDYLNSEIGNLSEYLDNTTLSQSEINKINLKLNNLKSKVNFNYNLSLALKEQMQDKEYKRQSKVSYIFIILLMIIMVIYVMIYSLVVIY